MIKLFARTKEWKFASSTISLWLYFVAILIAEALVVFIEPWAGLSCYWILLSYSIIQAVFTFDNKIHDFLLGLSLIPLIRIISISLPLIKVPQLFWFPIIYLPLLAASLATMRVLGLRREQVYLVKGLEPQLQVLLGIFMGFLIGMLEYWILKPEPLVSSLSFEQIWLPVLILISTTGFVEELIFRGILQRLAETVMGFAGIIYISVIFAVLHLGFYSVLDIVFVFLVAVIFGITAKTTGSLLTVTLAHGIANILLFVVMPFF